MLFCGLTVGSGGNLSVRVPEGMWITPSGLAYDTMEEGDVVLIDGEGAVIAGNRRPSSEWMLHAAIYRHHGEAQAVVHTHSPYATALAVLEEPLPAMHYLVGTAGGTNVPVAPYARFGSEELARITLEAMGDRRAVLMAHHGLIAWGTTMEEAFSTALELEFCAKVYLIAKGTGLQVPLLSDEAMREAVEGFADYGQRGDCHAPRS